MQPHSQSLPNRIRRSLAPGALRLFAALACAAPTLASAQPTKPARDPSTAEGQAPANTVVLRYTRGGAWFVSEPLKQKYDKLLARVGALRADLDAGRISGADAQKELDTLQKELDDLRQQIDKQKVLVSPVKMHQQSETTEFDLGPSRLLVVTADDVHVEGWDGPGVKCVLEKTVLAADDQPADADLAGLKVVHHHGPAPELVGKSAAERAADEDKFLASPEGAKLTPEQRASRKKFVDSIADSYAGYRDFQGKPIDTIEIEGLTYEQGNRQTSVHITSPGGGGTLGSDWKRFASVTVYVPQCNGLALRGCLAGLDVKNVHAPLLLTRAGSRDRDYDGAFSVRDVFGPVTVDNAPLDLIDNVHGNLNLTGTQELVNTGTTHENDQRTSYTPPPRTLRCSHVEGDLTAHFLRSDLKLESIGGRIDVRNDFGDTTLHVAPPLPDKPHRILSESGKIEVHLAKNALGKLPLQALTNCGTVRTNFPQNVLEETDFSLARDASGPGYEWRGMKSVVKEEPGAFFQAADRLAAVLQGRDHSPGLDLISRGGVVNVVSEP